MCFKNKVVIITGGAQGIGKAIAQSYCAEGAIVVIADIDEEKGSRVVRQLEEGGGRALFCLTDVSEPRDISRMIELTNKEFGRIDILVNNAGISSWKSVYELEVQEWNKILNVNLRSVFLCSREAAKIMRVQGGGSIVNISSTRAIMSEPNSEAYAGLKEEWRP